MSQKDEYNRLNHNEKPRFFVVDSKTFMKISDELIIEYFKTTWVLHSSRYSEMEKKKAAVVLDMLFKEIVKEALDKDRFIDQFKTCNHKLISKDWEYLKDREGRNAIHKLPKHRAACVIRDLFDKYKVKIEIDMVANKYTHY
ncbi:hypothetical protein [Rickettsia endosymbiont of Halotydeus destructor]|uniref:hypothetical protein n=1 Tax=Rickettsia endosymbiont of Halotydeus destructor TaxID=2996754 RepID=UPI003BB17971